MPRWLRVIRGMTGMGLVFSVGVGAVASVLAVLAWLLSGTQGLPEMLQVAFASAVWAFPVGVAFSGLTALTARGRGFHELSLPRFAALGSGAGLLLFGVLALNAWDAWSPGTALLNAAVFVVLGGGAATASLVAARSADRALKPGDAPPPLKDG